MPLLDLAYVEDSGAEVDMNVVMAGDRFVEVQGTAEGMPFTRNELDALLVLASAGIAEIVELQAEMVAEPPVAATVGRRRPMTLRLVLATANPDKAAEIAAILGLGDRARAAARPTIPDVVEDADTLEGNARLKAVGHRARPPGSPRWPTTPASRSTSCRATRACARPATRARTPPTPTTSPSCSRRWRACTRPTARPGSAPSPWSAGPTGGEVVAEGVVDGLIAPAAAG